MGNFLGRDCRAGGLASNEPRRARRQMVQGVFWLLRLWRGRADQDVPAQRAPAGRDGGAFSQIVLVRRSRCKGKASNPKLQRSTKSRVESRMSRVEGRSRA